MGERISERLAGMDISDQVENTAWEKVLMNPLVRPDYLIFENFDNVNSTS